MGETIEPMRADRFWALVEMSGSDADKMTHMLMWFPKEDIIAFDMRLDEVLYLLDREVIHDVTGGPDDGFLYVRLWIISRGREYVAAVLADPQAAPHEEDDPDENEDFMYAAMKAYEEQFGESWEDVMLRYHLPGRGSGINRAAWPSRHGGKSDE
jgi:hypothetical protein